MKEQKMYVCEFCNTQYENKNDALKCEQNHKTPKKVKELRYREAKDAPDGGYPSRIQIEFNNGKTVWYKK